ncbi:MAG: MFS transporter [Hyphomicrobium sp.]
MATSETLDLTPAERLASLSAVIAASFGVGVSFGVGYPLTALTLENWGEEKWVIGLAGAAPAIATILVLPFAPRFLSRLGPVAAITIGGLLASLGFLALGWATTAPVWIAVRLIMSAGIAVPWLVGETWINLVAREETRGRVIAIYAIAFFSGFAMGPVALGWLGFEGWPPIVFGALGSALAGVPILLARRLAPDVATCHSRSALSAIRMAPVAMVGAFIGGFAEITYLSLIPNVGIAGGLSESDALQLLSAITIGGLLGQLPIGALADRVSRISILYGLAVAFIILSLILPAMLSDPMLARSAAFLIGAVILGFYTVGLVIIGERIAADDLAAANAGFIVSYQTGATLGPIAAGAAMTASPVTGFVVTVIALMLGSLAALVALRWQPGA